MTRKLRSTSILALAGKGDYQGRVRGTCALEGAPRLLIHHCSLYLLSVPRQLIPRTFAKAARMALRRPFSCPTGLPLTFAAIVTRAPVGLVAGLALLAMPTPAAALEAQSEVQHVGDCPHASCVEADTRTFATPVDTAAVSTLADVDGALADVPACCSASGNQDTAADNVEDGEGAGEGLIAGGGQQQQQEEQLEQAPYLLTEPVDVSTASDALAAAFSDGGTSVDAQVTAGAYATAASAAFGTLTAATAAGTAGKREAGARASAGSEAGASSSSEASHLVSPASTSVTADGNSNDADVAADAATARRALAATYPSLVANGSASATFPSAAFGAWCAADVACAAAGSLNLTLLHSTDAASVAAITSGVLNWPSPLSAAAGSGVVVTGQALVSGVVELQLEAYAAKKVRAGRGGGCVVWGGWGVERGGRAGQGGVRNAWPRRRAPLGGAGAGVASWGDETMYTRRCRRCSLLTTTDCTNAPCAICTRTHRTCPSARPPAAPAPARPSW